MQTETTPDDIEVRTFETVLVPHLVRCGVLPDKCARQRRIVRALYAAARAGSHAGERLLFEQFSTLNFDWRRLASSATSALQAWQRIRRAAPGAAFRWYGAHGESLCPFPAVLGMLRPTAAALLAQYRLDDTSEALIIPHAACPHLKLEGGSVCRCFWFERHRYEGVPIAELGARLAADSPRVDVELGPSTAAAVKALAARCVADGGLLSPRLPTLEEIQRLRRLHAEERSALITSADTTTPRAP